MCCEGIGNKLHQLIDYENKATAKSHFEFIKPFYNRWKGIQKFSQEELIFYIKKEKIFLHVKIMT